MTKQHTEENSHPGIEEPTAYLKILAEIGEKMEEIGQLLNYESAVPTSFFDHRNHMFVGALPIYYEDELVGYISIIDGWAAFSKPVFKDKA